MKVIWASPVIASILVLGTIGIFVNVNAEPGNTTIETVGISTDSISLEFQDPDGIGLISLLGFDFDPGGCTTTAELSFVLSALPITVTVTDCQDDPDVTVWEITSEGANCTEGSCLPIDFDGDGFNETVDCDDNDPLTFPGAAEICDGADNDCDGSIDEVFPVGDSCTVGIGACESSGTLVCDSSGSSTVCGAEAGIPSNEVCTDGIDNDCDGLTDLSDPACQSPEVCDGLDNDGDGAIDEGFDLGQACSVGVGACENSGVTVCTANGSGTECSVDAGTPSAELCDGLDNDCDGLTDEDGVEDTDPDLGVTCSLPYEGVCSQGTTVCENFAVTCIGTLPGDDEEVCDGLDNDCDGEMDEGSVCNQAPVCGDAAPSVSSLWPPNHKMHSITINGVTDPDGDETVILITGILQDEPTNGLGDGDQSPDGIIDGDVAQVRAERSGLENGRMYYILFDADDGNGGTCSGVVQVGVPHDKKDTPIGEGANFDSTQP